MTDLNSSDLNNVSKGNELTPYSIKLLENEKALHIKEIEELIELEYTTYQKEEIRKHSLLIEDITKAIEILTMLKQNK